MKMGFLRRSGAQSCCRLTEQCQWVRLANLSEPALLPSMTYAASRKPFPRAFSQPFPLSRRLSSDSIAERGSGLFDEAQQFLARGW